MVALATLEEQAETEVAKRILARQSLEWFWRKAFPRFEIHAWQIDLCERLVEFVADCDAGLSPRLIILAPPQHGKSMIVSRAMIAWILGNHPDWPVIIGSYAKKLASGHGRWIRNTLESPWFEGVFPTPSAESKLPSPRLAPDSKAVDEFATVGGGQVLARGVGGGTTGNPAKLFVVDDPFADRKEADSKVYRDNVWDWFGSTVSTRLAPGGGILVMHTRWHNDDLVGRLTEASAADEQSDQWEVVTYRAIAEDDDCIKRPIGGALGRYSKEQLEKKRRSMSPRDWLSLYQQRPTAVEGSYFKPAMVNRLKGPMTFELVRFYQAWDLALTPEQIGNGDYSVGVNVGIDPLGRWWLTDMCRGRWSPQDLAKQMVRFWMKHRAKMVWMEGGPPFLGVEPSLRNTMQRDGVWIPYEKISHRGLPKDIRAIAIRGIINGGNLYTDSTAPWWYDLEEELAAFPSGKHDDIVDALAYIGMKQDIMLKDKDRRELPKPPPVVERSQMVKRAYADLVNRQKAARKGDRDDW